MVYKIIGTFSNEKFPTILQKVSKFCSCIYRNETLYVALNDVRDADIIEAQFKKIFKPQKDFFITKIDTHNVLKEDELILGWCREAYVRLESQLFEIKNQEKLNQVWADMDVMEEKLQNKLKEKIKN